MPLVKDCFLTFINHPWIRIIEIKRQAPVSPSSIQLYCNKKNTLDSNYMYVPAPGERCFFLFMTRRREGGKRDEGLKRKRLRMEDLKGFV